MAIKEKKNSNKFEHKLKMNLNIVACALKITPKRIPKKMANGNAWIRRMQIPNMQNQTLVLYGLSEYLCRS